MAELESSLPGIAWGLFMMEGHELELDGQAKILNELGFKEVQVLTDLTGAKRFLKAKN